MTEISKKDIEEFKNIYLKQYGKKLSDKEAYEAGHKLVQLVELLLETDREEQLRNRRLEKEPKGFHLDGIGYTCRICHNSISNDETWYDKYGIKCLNCQRAQEKKIIPISAVKNTDSWYASWQLQSEFGLHSQTIKKMIREGKLKSRDILDEKGNIYYQIFLKKENPYLLELKNKLIELS